jgi:hypothetical protein
LLRSAVRIWSDAEAPSVASDSTHGYKAGDVWLLTTTSPTTVYQCLSAATGAAVWRVVVTGNADGNLEGPIVSRDSNDPQTGGGNEDVPLEGELVTRGGVLAVGDGSTIGGLPYTLASSLYPLDKGFVKPSGGFAFVTRSNATVMFTCEVTNSGTYTVIWWDGTREVVATGELASKTPTANSDPKLVKVFPTLLTNAITVVTVDALGDVDAIDFSDMPLLTNFADTGATIHHSRHLDLTRLPALETLIMGNLSEMTIDTDGCPSITIITFYTSSEEKVRAILRGRDWENIATGECSLIDLTDSDLSSVSFYFSYQGFYPAERVILDRCVLTQDAFILITGSAVRVSARYCTGVDYITTQYPFPTTHLDLSGSTGLHGFSFAGNGIALESLRAVGLSLTTATDDTYIGNMALSAEALDQFFTDLATGTATIYVAGNPGAATCDPSIATAKGYTVVTTA